MSKYNIQTLRNIESARPEGEGFSIESSEYADYVGDELHRLSDAMEKWTEKHLSDDPWYEEATPFLNSGYRFANDVFIACAYDWSDYETYVNFYHFASHLDITWYKHAWRGTYGHNLQTENAIANGELTHIIDDCIDSLCNTKENLFEWTE